MRPTRRVQSQTINPTSERWYRLASSVHSHIFPPPFFTTSIVASFATFPHTCNGHVVYVPNTQIFLAPVINTTETAKTNREAAKSVSRCLAGYMYIVNVFSSQRRSKSSERGIRIVYADISDMEPLGIHLYLNTKYNGKENRSFINFLYASTYTECA